MFWLVGYSAQYGPEFLIDYEVVIVTINYRLGMLGFLSMDDPELSGNQGLMDQALALEWLRDTIGMFGEDPQKVNQSIHG